MGLSRSGKTTVFEAVTGRTDVQPSHKEKFNMGVVKVPDGRISKLSEIFNPKKTTFPEIEFLDYINTDNQSKSLSAEYITKLKECDGILKVVRNFRSDTCPPALLEIDPYKELSELDDEILFNDMEIVEKRLSKLKTAKYKLSQDEKSEMSVLEKFQAALNSGKMLSSIELAKEEVRLVKNYALLSFKKEIVLINCNEADDKVDEKLKSRLESQNRMYAVVSAENEKELYGLEESERIEMAKEMHINEFAIETVIRQLYYLLDLITFLTMGEDEVKGWTITKGTQALKAAGKIHSDIERGFIKAQVVSFDDFIKHGSIKECSKSGVLRFEGKEYTVKDGDIIEFKFNV